MQLGTESKKEVKASCSVLFADSQLGAISLAAG